jgi:cob(I)alamin adenosyltransferase
VDELESLLGVARLYCEKEENKENVLYVQRALFTVNAELATAPDKLGGLPHRVDADFLKVLEEKRAALEETIEVPRGFVVTGGTIASAYLDYARSVARRVERKIIRLLREGAINNKYILIWFNRLSDYLYLLARSEGGKPKMVKEA